MGSENTTLDENHVYFVCTEIADRTELPESTLRRLIRNQSGSKYPDFFLPITILTVGDNSDFTITKQKRKQLKNSANPIFL